MTYLNKRDRVFYPAGDGTELSPRPRTAGRIKNMLSCTDTRAWNLDSEARRQHLLEVLNNPGQNNFHLGHVVPIDVLIDTLIANKTAEIDKLKKYINYLKEKIEVYESLNFTEIQKAEINEALNKIKEIDSSCSVELNFNDEGDFELENRSTTVGDKFQNCVDSSTTTSSLCGETTLNCYKSDDQKVLKPLTIDIEEIIIEKEAIIVALEHKIAALQLEMEDGFLHSIKQLELLNKDISQKDILLKEVMGAQEIIKKLQNELNCSRTNRNNEKQLIKQEMDSLKDYCNKILEKQKKFDEIASERDRLKTENRDLNDLCEASTGKVCLLEKKSKELEQRFNLLKQEHFHLDKDYHNLKDQLNKLLQERDYLKNNNRELRKQIDQVKKAGNKLSLQKNESFLQEMINNIETEKLSLREHLDKLMYENVEIKKQLQLTESDLINIRNEDEKNKEKLVKLNSDKELLKIELNHLKQEILDLDSKQQTQIKLENEVDYCKVKTELAKVSEEKYQLELQIKNLLNYQHEIEDKYKERVNENDLLKKQLIEYEMLRDELSQMRLHINYQHDLEKKCQEHINECDMLRMQLTELDSLRDEANRLRFRAKEADCLRMERDRLQCRVDDLTAVECDYLQLVDRTHNFDTIKLERDLYKTRINEYQKSNQIKDSSISEMQLEIKQLMIQLEYMVKGQDTQQKRTNDAINDLREQLSKKNKKLQFYEEQLVEFDRVKDEVHELQKQLARTIETAEIEHKIDNEHEKLCDNNFERIQNEYINVVDALTDKNYQLEKTKNVLVKKIKNLECQNNAPIIQNYLQELQNLSQKQLDLQKSFIEYGTKLRLFEPNRINIILNDTESSVYTNLIKNLHEKITDVEQSLKFLFGNIPPEGIVESIEKPDKIDNLLHNSVQIIYVKTTNSSSNSSIELVDDAPCSNFDFYNILDVMNKRNLSIQASIKTIEKTMESYLESGEDIPELEKHFETVYEKNIQLQKTVEEFEQKIESQLKKILKNDEIADEKQYESIIENLNNKNEELSETILELRYKLQLKDAELAKLETDYKEEVMNASLIETLRRDNETLLADITESSKSNTLLFEHIELLEKELNSKMVETREFSQNCDLIEFSEQMEKYSEIIMTLHDVNVDLNGKFNKIIEFFENHNVLLKFEHEQLFDNKGTKTFLIDVEKLQVKHENSELTLNFFIENFNMNEEFVSKCTAIRNMLLERSEQLKNMQNYKLVLNELTKQNVEVENVNNKKFTLRVSLGQLIKKLRTFKNIENMKVIVTSLETLLEREDIDANDIVENLIKSIWNLNIVEMDSLENVTFKINNCLLTQNNLQTQMRNYEIILADINETTNHPELVRELKMFRKSGSTLFEQLYDSVKILFEQLNVYRCNLQQLQHEYCNLNNDTLKIKQSLTEIPQLDYHKTTSRADNESDEEKLLSSLENQINVLKNKSSINLIQTENVEKQSSNYAQMLYSDNSTQISESLPRMVDTPRCDKSTNVRFDFEKYNSELKELNKVIIKLKEECIILHNESVRLNPDHNEQVIDKFISDIKCLQSEIMPFQPNSDFIDEILQRIHQQIPFEFEETFEIVRNDISNRFKKLNQQLQTDKSQINELKIENDIKAKEIQQMNDEIERLHLVIASRYNIFTNPPASYVELVECVHSLDSLLHKLHRKETKNVRISKSLDELTSIYKHKIASQEFKSDVKDLHGFVDKLKEQVQRLSRENRLKDSKLEAQRPDSKLECIRNSMEIETVFSEKTFNDMEVQTSQWTFEEKSIGTDIDTSTCNVEIQTTPKYAEKHTETTIGYKEKHTQTKIKTENKEVEAIDTEWIQRLKEIDSLKENNDKLIEIQLQLKHETGELKECIQLLNDENQKIKTKLLDEIHELKNRNKSLTKLQKPVTSETGIMGPRRSTTCLSDPRNSSSKIKMMENELRKSHDENMKLRELQVISKENNSMLKSELDALKMEYDKLFFEMAKCNEKGEKLSKKVQTKDWDAELLANEYKKYKELKTDKIKKEQKSLEDLLHKLESENQMKKLNEQKIAFLNTKVENLEQENNGLKAKLMEKQKSVKKITVNKSAGSPKRLNRKTKGQQTDLVNESTTPINILRVNVEVQSSAETTDSLDQTDESLSLEKRHQIEQNNELQQEIEKLTKETLNLRSELEILKIENAFLKSPENQDLIRLRNALQDSELKLQKLKEISAENIASLKSQYDRDMHNILGQHNDSVLRLQQMHEDTLAECIREHEQENDNLREYIKELRIKMTQYELGNFTEKNDESEKKLSKMQNENINIEPKRTTCPEKILSPRRLVATPNLAAIVDKILYEGIEHLTIQELTLLHARTCTVTKSKKKKDPITDEDKYLKRLHVLEIDLVRKQKEAIERMRDLEHAIRQERQELTTMRNTLTFAKNRRSLSENRNNYNYQDIKSSSPLSTTRSLQVPNNKNHDHSFPEASILFKKDVKIKRSSKKETSTRENSTNSTLNKKRK